MRSLGFKQLFNSSRTIPSMIYSARASPGTPKVRPASTPGLMDWNPDGRGDLLLACKLAEGWRGVVGVIIMMHGGSRMTIEGRAEG